MAGKCLFNQSWLINTNYKDWLQCHPTDRHQAKCTVCCKSFSIAKMGESALKSHMKGAKHTQLLSIKVSSNISLLLKPKTSETVVARKEKTEIDTHVVKSDVMDAEIIWTMKTIKSHNSYRSNDDIERVFRRMFADSAIASKFSCGAKKTSYYAVFGIAPYLKDLLLQDLAPKQHYVLLFDESLNEMRQKKQMDVHVRFWSNDTVITMFFTSVFMGHAMAEDLFEAFKTAILPLKLFKVLQLSMDGPNVNWKFFSMLQKETAKEHNKQLLNIGSCGLHIVHNAFQCGCQATNWEISSFLQSLYYLFKDSPARREEFAKLVGNESFPKKFVKHRWLENILAAECALELLPDIVRYVNAVKKKSLPTPQCKSFSVVKHSLEDNLLEVKLHIFLSVAKLLHPFLLKYQTDKPMIFFLSDDFRKLLTSLLQRFIQPHSMKEANTLFKLLKLDFKDPKGQCKTENIDIGFIASKKAKVLRDLKKVSEHDIFDLRMECKNFLVTVVAKLTEKSPVTHSLVRHLSCFDPQHMANNKQNCMKKLRLVLNYLAETNRLPEAECDYIITVFRFSGH